MKEYEKQLEEEKQRSAQQYDYLKKQEEVMFTAIHKVCVGVGLSCSWVHPQ